MTDTTPLLTPTEAARIFNVDPKTVVRWIRTGALVGLRTPGGHYRVRRSDVDRLIAANAGDAA